MNIKRKKIMWKKALAKLYIMSVLVGSRNGFERDFTIKLK